MNIGYARVSTLDQNLDLQLQALRKAGCKKIFREKVSGASRKRPEFQRMLEQLRQGDTVIVWKLDRLARSTRDLLETMETIGEAGARLYEVANDKELFPSCPHKLRGARGKVAGDGRGDGQRFCDAKPQRYAEAGQDSFAWPTTPLAASLDRLVVAVVSA
jgi:hypothetical protein